MKVLGFIVGGIVIFVISAIAIAQVYKSQEDKKELVAEAKLSEKSLATMVSSEEKIQAAQKLLSKEQTSLKDQSEARRLIDEAVADARRAVDDQPNNPRTWYYLSETYQKLLDVNPKAAELSIDALNHALDLSSEQPELLNERATMYIFLERFPEAEKDLQKAIQLDAKDANNFYKLGNVYKETGRKDLARKLYLQAKELTSADNKMALAQIDAQMKLLEKLATPAAKPTGKK